MIQRDEFGKKKGFGRNNDQVLTYVGGGDCGRSKYDGLKCPEIIVG